REWKSIVPSQDGEVLELTENRIVARMVSGRRQTYQLGEKSAYVRDGDTFLGGASIIAGAVPRLAPLAAAKRIAWDPLQMLDAPDAVDRYAAAKAMPYRASGANARSALLNAVKSETDDRVSLEIAAAATRLGADAGLEHIVSVVNNHARLDLRMEGV